MESGVRTLQSYLHNPLDGNLRNVGLHSLAALCEYCSSAPCHPTSFLSKYLGKVGISRRLRVATILLPPTPCVVIAAESKMPYPCRNLCVFHRAPPAPSWNFRLCYRT